VFFPVIGRFPDSTYTLDGRTYPIGVHGFARDREFELVQQEEHALGWRLVSDDATLKSYPFRFELRVGYRLEANHVVVDYVVRNEDAGTMWFSIGGHPGFNCPFGTDGAMEDYVLEFEKPERVSRRIVQDGFLAPEPEPFLDGERVVHLSKELFKRLAIVLTGVRSKHVTLKSPKSRRSVTVHFDGFPYLAIWSPPAGGSLVCIEPWQGVLPTRGSGKDLTEREGIRGLEPGREARFTFSIAIEGGREPA
jgi:galactose mutarotase-like enzyme